MSYQGTRLRTRETHRAAMRITLEAPITATIEALVRTSRALAKVTTTATLCERRDQHFHQHRRLPIGGFRIGKARRLTQMRPARQSLGTWNDTVWCGSCFQPVGWLGLDGLT